MTITFGQQLADPAEISFELRLLVEATAKADDSSRRGWLWLWPDGNWNLECLLWIHTRQQQRSHFHLILPTLGGSQTCNLKHTLLRLRNSHVCPKFLTSWTGWVVAVKGCWVACASRDTADERLTHSFIAFEMTDAESDES